jgi:hypothetical protein
VLKLGDDTPAARRQAGDLRDTLRPERAMANRQPGLPAGTNRSIVKICGSRSFRDCGWLRAEELLDPGDGSCGAGVQVAGHAE